MALGAAAGRSRSSAAASKQSATRASASVLNDIDDLYENNAFDDDGEPRDNSSSGSGSGGSLGNAKKPPPRDAGAGAAPATKGKEPPKSAAKQLEFDVWVARKDKYERIAAALAQLKTERAASDEQWLEVAVALAATDCLLKTGKTDKCDCAGVCRDASHSVTKQRTRCQCPARKCSLCKRCVNTSPGTVTDKMAAVLSPFRLASSQSLLALAELIVQAGEGQSLVASGKPKITTAVLRMAQTVLSQCSILENDDGTRLQRPCACPVRSLGDLWVKWTTRFHTFSRTPLTAHEASRFSSGTRQMMELEEHPETREKTYFMTLKWHQAAKPQKGDTAKIAARRALTPDQKKQNAFFLGLCKKYWTTAQHRVVAHLQEKMAQYEALPPEKTKKLPSAPKMELLVLNRLGTKRIMQWLEEDREEVEEKRSEEHKEKTEGGIVAHNAWVKRKDRLRIRMPAAPDKAGDGDGGGRTVAKPGGSWKPPRFDFSSGKGVVRKHKLKVPSSTVELMRASGLKYVHAMSEGFQGRGGDLEKSKELLVKKGHILRANFAGGGGGGDGDENPFSKDRYLFEREHNAALKKKREGDRFRQDKSKESYEAWIAHKALRDRAVKLLQHIPKPSGDAGSSSGNGATGDDDDAIPASVRWEEVGKALKAVDRGLLDEWVKWSDGFKNATRCRVLWESYAPVACDVHCTSSAVRDVFLKLLHRRGVNYRKAFLEHCGRKHKQLLARGDDDELPEEMADDALMARFAALSAKEFTKLLLSLGIVLQPEEVQRLLEYFDANGDQLVSMREFLDVVGEKRRAQCHGDTDLLLRQVCMWETVCHECGMLNAFQLVLGSSKPGSSSRVRAELPGHAKRREQSARFDCDPECDMRELKRKAPARCTFAAWSDERAAPFLKKLELWSAEQREQRALQQLVTEGSPPDAPAFFRDDDEALDPTTQLLLRWQPPPVRGNNGAAFYILETIGAEGTPSFRLNDYREVYRDPKDYLDNQGEPRYHYVVSGLAPNTKYGFRVRALNGFGAGPYSFAYFFTAPSVPPAPLAIKVSANSIQLGWESSGYYRKQLRELRQVFEEADADGDGVISRDEFMEEIERRKPRLLEFLQKTSAAPSSSGAESSSRTRGAPLSVFDAIETDDNECISWDEFVRFFHGFLDDKGDATESSRGPATLAASGSAKSLREAGGSSAGSGGARTRKAGAAAPAPTGATQCRYILKQCSNEAEGEYVEIYRGAKSAFVVHGLASGSTYQFRVQAFNEENMFSLHSEPVVVNTLLQTPAAPSVVESSLTSSSVKLKWPPANARPCLSHEALQARSKQANPRKSGGPVGDDQIARILKEWAQETSVDDGGVDFRAKFDRYDADQSGFIELPEFKTLLEELGVPVTGERLAAYLEEFDTDSDGKVSFREFTRWWSRTDVQYVLKRDQGRQDRQNDTLRASSSVASLAASAAALGAAASSNDQMTIVSYRGKDPWTTVSGLEANTQYVFRLRAVSSHASSQLSEGLEVWTAPNAPSCAGVVTVLSSLVHLCWYPGVGGAYKYIVECKFIETLPGSTGDAAVRRGAATGGRAADWSKAYEGSESLATVADLLPNTVYRLRVFALNRAGAMSEQSTVAQICTQSKDEERASGSVLRPSNAADHFTLECCEEGDIVAGDTILFCERIYRSESGKIVSEDAAPRVMHNASLYSVASFAGSSSGADAIGERTVAARVVGVKLHEKHGSVVTMVVVWSTAQLYEDVVPKARTTSAAAAKALANKALRTSASVHSTSHNISLASAASALTPDLKISRKEKSLYRYDTFRKEWQDELARHASTWEM
ncbi:hypothetical protein PybrP1_006689 [[Pythium] brassicae (nom. inval.)]|nr:hypothetical protein PybrP1_006689 [[Pythium] brassicae (nom. inval.)]